MTKQEKIETLLRPFLNGQTAEDFLYDLALNDSTRHRIEILNKIKDDICDRRTGRTTRICDAVIQEFFESEKGDYVYFNDHQMDWHSRDNIGWRVSNRLVKEFSLELNKHFVIDRYGDSMRLLKNF